MNVIAKLEALIDKLLEKNRSLERDVKKLEEENLKMMAQRDHFLEEIDRILGKIEHFEQSDKAEGNLG